MGGRGDGTLKSPGGEVLDTTIVASDRSRLGGVEGLGRVLPVGCFEGSRDGNFGGEGPVKGNQLCV